MQKIQILFPDPVMQQLRAVAQAQDRPVSELVRRAVDRMLEQSPPTPAAERPRFPTFRGGGVQLPADRLKDVLYGAENDDGGRGHTPSRPRKRRKR